MAATFARVAALFFDKGPVARALDAKTRKVLSKFGAYVRRGAQRSMRTRRGPAPPGRPPHAHGRRQLRKFLFFYYDPRKKSVVVGPVPLPRTARRMIPMTHEYGGTIPRVRLGRLGRKSGGRYPARPYMRPAFGAEIGKVKQWYAEA